MEAAILESSLGTLSARPALADPSLLKAACFVEGAWVGKATEPVSDRATAAVVGYVQRFGYDEAVDAIEAAKAAFPAGAARTAKDRSRMRRSFDLIAGLER